MVVILVALAVMWAVFGPWVMLFCLAFLVMGMAYAYREI